jgi:hypothetical protein
MQYLRFFFLFAFLPVTCLSQSISISAISAHSGNQPGTVPLKEGTITIRGNSVQLTSSNQSVNQTGIAGWAVSDEGLKVGLLRRENGLELSTYDYRGSQITENDMEFFEGGDETLEIYQFDDGRTVVRDNVANFSFFDASGKLIYSVSNSSQSSDGESESKLAADPSGSTVVLYNPIISAGGQTGSRASLVFGPNNTEVFYQGNNREITHLSVNENGTLISLIAGTGSNTQAIVFDRFGNELNRFDFDDTQLGVTPDATETYITAYSSSRIQVYNLITGERLGSASSRQTIIHAQYHPEDEVILAVGGAKNNGRITDPMMMAVHLSKRQIARSDITISVSAHDGSKIRQVRLSPDQYRITGLNQHLDVTTQF